MTFSRAVAAIVFDAASIFPSLEARARFANDGSHPRLIARLCLTVENFLSGGNTDAVCLEGCETSVRSSARGFRHPARHSPAALCPEKSGRRSEWRRFYSSHYRPQLDQPVGARTLSQRQPVLDWRQQLRHIHALWR